MGIISSKRLGRKYGKPLPYKEKTDKIEEDINVNAEKQECGNMGARKSRNVRTWEYGNAGTETL